MASSNKRKACDIEDDNEEGMREQDEDIGSSEEGESGMELEDEGSDQEKEEESEENESDYEEEKEVEKSKEVEIGERGSENEEEVEEEYEDDEEVMDSDELPISTTVMTVSELRKKLGDPEGAAAIKTYFAQKDSLDSVNDFLKQGGRVRELASQLTHVDIRKAPAVDIFSAMGLVILKAIKEYPDRESELAEDCTEFITNYLTQLSPMLSQKTALNRKKTVLKLLTAIASINDALALQILSVLDLKKEVVYYFAEHNNPLEQSSIRVLFAQFLLAFIVGHSAKVINRLCSKKYWIPALFPEMKYDLFQTVEIVLTSLEEWLISRKDVTKNSKLYVFNSKSLSHLANLYEWNPKSWRENVKDKKIAISDTDQWELSQVRSKVHKLLLNLCTSVKFGVIFNDPRYGTTQQNANSLVEQFIVGLSQPWDDELKNELVTKVLLICPDLIKPYCTTISSILKLPTSAKWIKAMEFIIKIIEDVEVSPEFLNNKTWLQIIYNVYAPSILLEVITSERLLTDTVPSRTLCLNTFSVIVNKLHTIYSLITKPNIKNIFTTNLSQYLIKKAPNAEILLGCLKISFKEDDKECTSLIMDLILSLHSFFPQLFDIVRYNKDCIKMVQEKKESCKSKKLSKHTSVMILKLIKLEMLLNPQVNTNEDYIKHLEDSFAISADKGEKCKALALELIREILENSGLFINTPFELKIWMHLLADHLTKDNGLLLAEALKYANEHRFEIFRSIIKARENAAETVDIGHMSLDDFINLSVNEENEKPFENTENKQNEEAPYGTNLDLSPLLPAILIKASKKSDKMLGFDLLVSFMIHYMHTQVSLGAYKSLLENYKNYATEKVQEYIVAWYEEPDTLNLSPFTGTIYSHISEYVLLKSDEEPFELIDLQNKVTVELCLNQCIFTICHLSLIEKALKENIARTIKIVKYLMSATIQIPLTHPQLLNDFHPVKTLHNSTDLTSLVITIIENAHFPIPESVMNPYSERFYFELKYAKKKKNGLERCSNIKPLLQIIPLNKDQIIQLISIVLSIKPKYFYFRSVMTPWVHVLEYLLRKACEFEIRLSDEALNKLCELINELNRAFLDITGLFKEFYNYLVKFNIEISGTLYDNFQRLFINLCTGVNWYEDITIFLMKKIGGEFSELPMDLSLDRAVKLIASLTVKKKNYECILTSHYNEIIVSLCTDPSVLSLQHLSTLVKTVISKKTTEKLCTDISKMYNEIVITEDTLLFLKEVFDKSKQNGLFVYLLNQWLNTYSQDLNHIQSEGICRILLDVAQSVEDFTQLQNSDSDVIKYLITYGIELPSAPMLDHLALYVKYNCINSPPNVILELISSHNKFMNLILEENQNLKISVLNLVMGLFQMDKSLIKDSHVSLFLSAYHSTLIESDQIILKMLQLFETCSINMARYKPFIWGESALEHYASIPSKRSPTLTLDHLQKDMIKNTIKNFPIQRELEGICKVEFEDVYDPAFLLPVLNQVISSDIRINPWKFFNSGAVAMALASLSSNCSQIRSLACLIIKKIHASYNKKKDAMVWYHFIESIRQGLSELPRKDKVPKISSVVSTFLARSSLIIVDPTHYLYKEIHNFIHARVAMNLKTIPALLEIFHSTEDRYRLHQQWILEVLRDGIREPSDFQLALNCFAFKFILDYHSCSLANREIKILIEELVAKCLQHADKERHFLINNYSLLPWLELSGRPKVIIQHLPHKLVSQFKALVTYICREEKTVEMGDNDARTHPSVHSHSIMNVPV